jgi:hypothetical protein
MTQQLNRWTEIQKEILMDILKEEYNRNIMNRDIPKQCQTTTYKVYFNLILTYNAKTLTLTKRSKSKIQTMGIKFLTSTEVKTRQNRIQNHFLEKVEFKI